MRHPFAAVCFPVLLLVSLSCAAQEPQIDPARIKAHVEFLASDALEGRKAGTRGYDVAARYVASQLAQLGTRPAGDSGTWFQTVSLLQATPVIAAGKARIVHDGTVTELVNKEDFLPRAYFATGASEVTAPATFVGHGILAPELGYDDFAGVELAGRIAVVLSGAPPTFPADQRAHYSDSSTKYRALSERGAVGWIDISTPIDETRGPLGTQAAGELATVDAMGGRCRRAVRGVPGDQGAFRAQPRRRNQALRRRVREPRAGVRKLGGGQGAVGHAAGRAHLVDHQ